MSTVAQRIRAWEKDLNITPFERCVDWALYNESGGAFDRKIPGVIEGKFTPGDADRPASKRSLLSRAVGLSNEAGDTGGWTKFGIAQNANPQIDVPSLTLAQAVELYRKGYWIPCRCDELPFEVAFMVFDAACGSGPNRAIKLLQRTVGVAEDGKFGPATLAACKAMDPDTFADKFMEVHCAFGRSIAEHNPSQQKWVAGWTRRWRVLKYGEKE